MLLFAGCLLGVSACDKDAETTTLPDMAAAGGCGTVPTTGQCVDGKTVASCVTGQSGGPRVITTTCGTNYACVTEGADAYCKLMAECREGQSRCSGTTANQICQGGLWRTSTCTSGEQCRVFPGLGGVCAPTGTAVTVRGTLMYRYRPPRSDLSGLGPLAASEARGLLVAVQDAGEILGSTFTDTKGAYSVPLYRVPSASATLFVLPVGTAADNTPLVAVAVPVNGQTASVAPSLWSYSLSGLPAPVAGVINLGTSTIDESAGSGAVHIFIQAEAELMRAAALYGRLPKETVVLLWKPNVDMFCGACFLNRSLGGTDIGTGAQPLHFDTTILLSGSNDSPLQWSQSVIHHEIGHYLMDQYGRSPGEGGTHFLDGLSVPGLAYSEGFATYSGQAGISVQQGQNNPIYFSVQQGTAFYLDISRAAFSLGELPLPDPGGPIDQDINENIVASILWDAAQKSSSTKVMQTLATPRLAGKLNRGYKTLDLVDFADALQCTGAVTAEQLSATMTKYQFPWC